MSDDLLALLEKDPAAGILAAADLREQRATAATPSPWQTGGHDYDEGICDILGGGTPHGMDEHAIGCTVALTNPRCHADAEHIAAEASPAHALAAVRRWRGVVERHKPYGTVIGVVVCAQCRTENLASESRSERWPCPDLTETADEARAYLGVTA